MSNMSLQLELTDSPTPKDCGVVMSGLAAFVREQANLRNRPLAVLVRDTEGGVLGGLLGHTGGDWLSVDVVWLPAALRRQGLGMRLMEAAEAEARDRGCVGIFLNTASFEAPGFYERLGYKLCGVVEGYPCGHNRLTFSKRLVDSNGPRA